MKVRFRSLLSLPLALALLLPPQLSAEMRKWTNKAGASIEAEMTAVDVTARTITLTRADGKTFTFPIDSLSEADRAYAGEQWKKMQSNPATAPKPATAGAPAAAAPGTPPPPRPALTVTPAAKFKIPNAAEYVRTVSKTRPRLLLNAAGWAQLKAQAASDPVLGKMLANLKSAGDKLAETPELTRIFGEQGNSATPGSKAIYRMALLSTLHQVDGSPAWADKAVKELVAITDKATFQNWYADKEPHVTADFLIAACIGYDQFKGNLSAKQVQESRTYIIQKGVEGLAAHLNEEPIPVTAIGKAAGIEDEPTQKTNTNTPPKKNDDAPPTAEEMACASALIISAICLVDEDASAARKALDAAAKVFGKGMLQFAPAGIWPEGMQAGEHVLDYAIMVMQTLRANAGSDLGFSSLEGLPQAGLARLHLVGSTGSVFNYGDNVGEKLSREWVSTWLAGAHGNLGQKALTAGTPPGPDTAYLGLTGHFIYYNAQAAGTATPDTLDYGTPGGQVAALRSSWDRGAMFVAVKGGDNRILTTQLDQGTFVLDADGVRWAVDLGPESDKVGDFKPKVADRTKRYALYLEGTVGQNTLLIGGNQELDARSAITVTHSTPAAGLAIVDLGKAYSKVTKDALRGVMVVRGAKPYVVLQDELAIKNTTAVTWSMHTKATVTTEGSKATLTSGGKTLHAVLLSPAGAVFSTEDPPEPSNAQMRKLTDVHVLKVKLADVKGAQTIAIAFSTGEPPPEHKVKPLAEWVPKR